MTDTPQPIPIREGIVPEVDLEREMLDYCQTQLRQFRRDNGMPPTRIAIVLTGMKDGNMMSLTNSWADDECPRIINCSTAATLLMKRAME